MNKSIKVLWFTNVQLPALCNKMRMNLPLGGGWMESLREALEIHAPNIELGITSYCPSNSEPFHEGNSTYFTIPQKPIRNRLANIFNSWRADFNSTWDVAPMLPVISQFKPDIIHVHGTENQFGLLADQIILPVVISLQGLLTLYQPHLLTGLHWRDLGKAFLNGDFFKGRGWLHAAWSTRPRVRRELAIMSRCNHFIGRTEWDKAFVKLTSPYAHYHHCDELLRPEFQGAAWKQKDSKPGCVFATLNCEPRKGLLLLLDTLALLRKSGYDQVQFRIAGNIVATPIWPIVKRRLVSHDISVDSIEWLGQLRADKIVEELLRASIFVHPSAVDNSPNSLCEAMMVGTPCVASHVGGVPSIIKNDKEGLMSPAGDAYALAGQIIRLLENKDLALKLSKNARATALARHDPQRVAARMSMIYRSIIKQ